MKALTARQLEILPMLADGLSNPEIAAKFFVEESTVKSHMRDMFKRLGARDRTNAVVIAYEQGILGRAGDRRVARARTVLVDLGPVRRKAPDDSRFAELYDRLAAALSYSP